MLQSTFWIRITKPILIAIQNVFSNKRSLSTTGFIIFQSIAHIEWKLIAFPMSHCHSYGQIIQSQTSYHTYLTSKTVLFKLLE